MTAETVSLESALEAKREGQQRSLWDVTHPEIDDVRDAVRAALLRSVVSEGHCRPETVAMGDQTYQIRIPSTGKSAHAATVVVYRRATPTPVPAVA